jgi:phosphoribosylformimino-5-aminoimidazole carboxamide ribotide isomerase
MIVIPALDLRAGKCVRMQQGDIASATVYAEDPVAQAKTFVAQGAQRLHVIDLDAVYREGDNLDVVRAICRAVDVPVTVGGGVRIARHVQDRLDAGAESVILGTLLVDDERVARMLIGRFPEKIVAAIDARGTLVATAGWRETPPVDRDALVKRIAMWGITRVIFTEIRRDGMGEGYDIDALNAVAAAAEIRVTANGGARTVDDLLLLKRHAAPNIDSCIVGSALYKGTMALEEAIAAVR